MLDDQYTVKKQVAQDMALDYNNKISLILSEIDYLKKEIIFDKKKIVFLNERLQALFIKLSPKLIPSQIIKQREFNKQLRNIPLFKNKKVLDSDNHVVIQRQIIIENYFKYLDLLEKREIHLNIIMDKLGLTMPIKEEKRRPL